MLSPKAIMSGEQIKYKDYKLPFGSYCQVHEDTGPRNSLAVRAHKVQFRLDQVGTLWHPATKLDCCK